MLNVVSNKDYSINEVLNDDMFHNNYYLGIENKKVIDDYFEIEGIIGIEVENALLI